jgi:DNA-binding helix-hairpin-helix protein with protein kinase domain
VTPGTVVNTASGRRLTLGALIGKGGEGKIYSIDGNNQTAVKLYFDGNGLSRHQKVKAMIADRLSERSPLVAFPIEIVSFNGRFAGFTMRKVQSSKPLFQLCIPGDRKSEFPEADFRFLVQVALNFARAIANVNALGAIVGDINESGALINQRSGLVTLIDSDSFQYAAAGSVYPCLVGKPEYTPPELQGKQLRAVTRTANHDAFGLAVILFEILFLGRHPFSGIPRTPDHPTIAEAIQTGRFAYSPDKSRTRMDPPPHTPVLSDLPSNVAAAFQQAFAYAETSNVGRPTAGNWVSLLEALKENIIECNVNPAHYYSAAANSCPWCRFESGMGFVLFISHQPLPHSTFDVDQVLSRINAILSPGPAPDLLSLLPPLASFVPSPEARAAKARLRTRKFGAIAIVALATLLMASGLVWGIFLLIPAGVLFFGKDADSTTLFERKSRTEQEWQAALSEWAHNAGSHPFETKRSELGNAAGSYRALPNIEREMLAALDKAKRELQLRKHLESFKLSRAFIDSIGDNRKLTLRSFGIETAWDVKQASVSRVPGFGPVLTKKLTDWRSSIEARFRFEPDLPTDPVEIARVEAEISSRRQALEAELLSGVSRLETLKKEALAKRHLTGQYTAIYAAFKQAELDYKFSGLG